MKKLGLLLLVVCLLLVGCGAKEDTPAPVVIPRTTLRPAQGDGGWGYVNKAGTFVIQPQFQYAGNFSDWGLAPVQLGDAWGYVDLNGNMEIPAQFEYAGEIGGNG